MCDPITLTGIALAGGSLAANTIANNKIQNARNNVLATERLRQGRLDQEAQALNTQSQDRYVDFEGQQADRAGELGDYFAGQQIEAGNANTAANTEMIAPQSGSAVTVREEAKQRGKARDFTEQQGRALGDLRSFGDLLGDLAGLRLRAGSQPFAADTSKEHQAAGPVPFGLHVLRQDHAGLLRGDTGC